ncbi:hypothetical protein [Lentzea sp. NPDC003310]|uniref:hypothetical protein n=1 Tax=Lentzea sp. NPDC003310 TaxID=3154447 RepID=UPI0033AF9859
MRLIVAPAGAAPAVPLTTGSPTGQAANPSSPISTSPPGSGGRGDEVTQTRRGPLGPANRNFVNRANQTELREKPAGERGKAKRPDQPKIQEAGKYPIERRTLVANMVNRAGVLLEVTLPQKATDEQTGWLTEIDAANGDEFDSVFTNRLHIAHGKVYAYAAQIQEHTGRVDFGAIESPQPLASPPNSTGAPGASGDQQAADASPNPTDGVIPTAPEGTQVHPHRRARRIRPEQPGFLRRDSGASTRTFGVRMISGPKSKYEK